jgi:hypothetical protein
VISEKEWAIFPAFLDRGWSYFCPAVSALGGSGCAASAGAGAVTVVESGEGRLISIEATFHSEATVAVNVGLQYKNGSR